MIKRCRSGNGAKTYLEVTLGIIVPPVSVSTRTIKGIMDRTL